MRGGISISRCGMPGGARTVASGRAQTDRRQAAWSADVPSSRRLADGVLDAFKPPLRWGMRMIPAPVCCAILPDAFPDARRRAVPPRVVIPAHPCRRLPACLPPGTSPAGDRTGRGRRGGGRARFAMRRALLAEPDLIETASGPAGAVLIGVRPLQQVHAIASARGRTAWSQRSA